MRANRKKKKNGNTLLPIVKSTPSINLLDYTWLIYGRKKIGKTTLLSMFPKCLHFMWEPGAEAISIFKVPKKRPALKSWQEGLDVLDDLEEHNKEEQYQFRTACFDTGERAWKRCMQHMEKELGGHPGEKKDFGASWDKVSQEFQDAHLRISVLGMGFVVIAHETEKEFEDWDGRMYDQIRPKFSKGVADFYEGVIDNICYYHFVGRERFLQIRGDQHVVAGTRIDGRFLTPEGERIWKELRNVSEVKDKEEFRTMSRRLKKHQIIKIPMGFTPMEAYVNLCDAFNNKQTEIFNDDDEILSKGGKKHKRKRED